MNPTGRSGKGGECLNVHQFLSRSDAQSKLDAWWHPVAMAYAFDDISLALGGLRRIGKAAVLKTAAVKTAYRFESCALRSADALLLCIRVRGGVR